MRPLPRELAWCDGVFEPPPSPPQPDWELAAWMREHCAGALVNRFYNRAAWRALRARVLAETQRGYECQGGQTHVARTATGVIGSGREYLVVGTRAGYAGFRLIRQSDRCLRCREWSMSLCRCLAAALRTT